ncbi:MAG: SRPBCC family protein [Balneolaceae bacterium]|nr:SRPBCC family protein [Balneolaceae bacterium]
MKVTISRRIHASVKTVFRTISDIRNFSNAVPDVVDVEFLTDQKTGVGTRFKETREFRGREMSTVLEVTEYEENEKIRLISDAQGTVWDSTFIVEDLEGSTELTLVMKAKPYKFFARIMNLFMKGFMKKALAKDMDAVKNYCEKRSL